MTKNLPGTDSAFKVITAVLQSQCSFLRGKPVTREAPCWHLSWYSEELLFSWNISDKNLSGGKLGQPTKNSITTVVYSRIEASVTLYWKFLNTLWSPFAGVEDNLDDDDERSVVTSRHFMSPVTLNLRTAEAALLSLIIWLWSDNFNFITSSRSLWHNWTQMRCLLIYSIFMGGMIYFFPHNAPLVIFREEQLHYVIARSLGH